MSTSASYLGGTALDASTQFPLTQVDEEARRLVDQARPHVGAEMTAEPALRVALRGVSIGSGVREELAEYGARGAGERPPRGGFSGWALCGAPPRSYRTLLPMTAHGLAFH